MTTTLTFDQIHQITAANSEAQAFSVSGNIPGIQAHFVRAAYIREVMGPRTGGGSKAEVNAKFLQAWRQAHAAAAPQLAVEHVLDSLERWEAQYDRSPNHDIWRDCIMLLDGYDDDASGLVAESSMDGFVAAGQLYDYDYQRKQWFHVGPFDPADYDE